MAEDQAYINELMRARGVNTESETDVLDLSRTVEKIDQWSGFDHRATEGSRKLRTPPSWVKDKDDRRRVVAYRVAKAAQETILRLFHENDGPYSDFEQLREHGHASSFIERLADDILGEAPTIRVPGADDELPNTVPLPPRPEVPTDDADPVEMEAHEVNVELYRDQARRAIEEHLTKAQRHKDLVQLQRWFVKWTKDVGFWRSVLELEAENTTPLGDGVAYVYIDERGRPNIQVFEPDGLMKIYEDEHSNEEFPSRVHIAWERTEEGPRTGDPDRRILRRLTWEILPTGTNEDPEAAGSWKPAYSTETVAERCFFTDAEWDLDGSNPVTNTLLSNSPLDELPMSEARFRNIRNPFIPTEMIEADRIGLPIDFIPVVHFKHTVSRRYGRSALARLMGLFDDLAQADTSIALLSILIGEPPVVVSGGVVNDDAQLGSAAIIDVGPGGKGQKLGFADEMRAAIEYQGHLERQIIKMTSQSSELSGRENNEQSGRAIGLKMSPRRQTILKARLAREDSYALLFKMVQRFAIIARTEGYPLLPTVTNQETGETSSPKVYPAEMRWGTFIPEDLSELVERIILLRDRGILTDSDVYDLLVRGGMQFQNVDSSLQELRSLDVKTALPLVQIIGPKLAAQFMGREADKEFLESLMAGPEGQTAGGRPAPTDGRGNQGEKPKRERSAPAPNP